MEDDKKPEQDVAQDQEEEEEDEDKTILTVDAKMGAEEISVRDKITELAKPHLDNEELDMDSPEDMAKIEKELAKQIQDMLLKDFGKYWSVIVGRRFALGVGLRENDKFGNFKIGFFNVLVFQCNQTEAA
jgi:hypothetical protein